MPTAISICMVSDDFLPAATGVGTYLKLVAPALVRLGYRICVITTRRAGEPAIQIWEGITIYRVFTIKVFDFYQALPSKKFIQEILKKEKPDIVHQHYASFMMMQVCSVAKSMQIPQISTFHFSAEVLTQPLPMRPFRGLIRSLMVKYNNRVDLVIAPSKKLSQQIAAEGVKTPIQYITNPVAFTDDNSAQAIPTPPHFTILYAGRLGPEKNIGYLIKAFAELLKKIPDAILYIAGRGPEGKNLENLCAQLNLGSSVQFLGFLDHPTLAKHYKSCHVFVLPSLQEAQALVAMEAMWFSRPVIVTSAIVSAEETVEHKVSGYIVDPSSVADLTERLLTLAADPILCKKFGEAGRKIAESYRPELVLEHLDNTYKKILQRGPL